MMVFSVYTLYNLDLLSNSFKTGYKLKTCSLIAAGAAICGNPPNPINTTPQNPNRSLKGIVPGVRPSGAGAASAASQGSKGRVGIRG